MRLICFFACFFLGLGSLHAQSGKVYDNLSMTSDILGGERKYAVYLPPDYETSSRSYPVLYLLHGGGDDQTGWVQFGEVLHIADQAIREGRATAMVIVMPDASEPLPGYGNHVSKDIRYEDFFIEEFIPHAEAAYRIKGEKRYRAVAGLSRGGNGTFIYALRHPELFSSACPLSAYAGPLSLEEFAAHLKLMKQEASREQMLAYIDRYSVLKLIERLPDDQRSAVRWYIDCGDDDFLYEGNSLVHIAMKKRGISHEYRVRNGGHSWSYWRSALTDVLAFVSQGFRQN